MNLLLEKLDAILAALKEPAIGGIRGVLTLKERNALLESLLVVAAIGHQSARRMSTSTIGNRRRQRTDIGKKEEEKEKIVGTG
jgi:hypothetical protein